MRRSLVAAAALLALAMLPAHAAGGTVPGTNGRIAYQSVTSGPSDIFTIEPNGADPLGLTSGPLVEGAPSYSGDGERIAFGRAMGFADPDIWVMNQDGSDQTQLTTGGTGGSPSFSPDGSLIAFTQTVGGQAEIFVMSSDGGNVSRLTNNSVNDFSPAYSPDGTRIAFARGDAADNEIYVMGSGGESPTPLTTTPTDDREPSWSPDGSQIVYQAEVPAFTHIYVVPADGGPPTQLTFGPGHQENPAFSPDGSLIAFRNDEPLAVMNSDGSGIQPITVEGGANPDWQPVNPPRLEVTAGKQTSPKSVTATVVSQNENATATLDGTLKAPKPKPKASASKKKTVELDAVIVQLEPGVPATVQIPVSGKGKKLLKKSLKAGKRPRGSVTASATDDLGASASDSAEVKYKKKKKKK